MQAPRSTLLLGLLPLAVLAGCSDDPPRPNVLFVSIDTLRADRLGIYGHDVPTSPFIDQFASRAVLFEQCFSQSPKTAPSHMTMMTGLYPEAPGVLNFGRLESTRWSASVPPLAARLKDRGYRTVAQTEGGNIGPALGFDQGFDQYEVNDPSSFAPARKTPSETETGTEPWFLLLHTYAVHDPYVPPLKALDMIEAPPYDGPVEHRRKELRTKGTKGSTIQSLVWDRVAQSSARDRRRLSQLHDAGIRYDDEQLRLLFDDLERLGLTDDTVIVSPPITARSSSSTASTCTTRCTRKCSMSLS